MMRLRGDHLKSKLNHVLQKCMFFRSVFGHCFFNSFWVTAKVARRVFVREAACFSLSHQPSKDVKRAPFWDPG
jgi:hypothetical protein